VREHGLLRLLPLACGLHLQQGVCLSHKLPDRLLQRQHLRPQVGEGADEVGEVGPLEQVPALGLEGVVEAGVDLGCPQLLLELSVRCSLLLQRVKGCAR
jgi:hypothetical protein